jgi:hypothetical protein
MRKILPVFFILIFTVVIQSSSQVAQSGKTYQERSAAMYIYNFTRYFEWPADAKNGDFVIAIVGDNVLHSELEAIVAGRMVGTQKIVVQNHRNASDVTNCHILFLAENPSRRMNNVVEQMNGFPTLFITSLDGATRNGSVINFIVKDQTMRFELHRSNAVGKGLQVDSRLDNLAIVVD